MWMKDGLSIIPKRNLIKNIGFGDNATHTIKRSMKFETEPLLPLKFNDEIVQDKVLDLKYHNKIIYKPLWKYPLLHIKYLIESL